MTNNIHFYDVLDKIRKLSHNRSDMFLNKEEMQKQIYGICNDYLLLSPDYETKRHRTFLARLLYYNLYRGLYLYLQGANLNEIYLENINEVLDDNIASLLIKKDESFIEIQKNDLKLQMGLFAYADVSSNMQLRYLYGPHDLPDDRLKTFPHFYIKPFYCHEKEDKPGMYEFKPINIYSFWEHSSFFYYGRAKKDYRELDFVQILQAKKGSPHWQRRTRFEREKDIIYASDGEMGACIFAWLLLCIPENQVNDLDKILSLESQEQKISGLKNLVLEIDIKNQSVRGFTKPGANELEPLPTWISNQKTNNLFHLLKLLGLIRYNESELNADITERGYQLIKWVSLYLKNLGGEVLSILGYDESFYYRIVRGVQRLSLKDFPVNMRRQFLKQLFEFRFEKNTLSGTIFQILSYGIQMSIDYLVNHTTNMPDDRLMDTIILNINNLLEDKDDLPWDSWLNQKNSYFGLVEKLKHIREPFCRRRFILHAVFPDCILLPGEFFPSWLDGIDSILVEEFINSIDQKGKGIGLIELLKVVQLFLKWRKLRENIEEFKERCRFNLIGHHTLRASRDQVETASRAWIVFPVHYDYVDYQESSNIASVGFFLGTFKDSDDNGKGYMEHFSELGTELIERIYKIRQVMELLAQVENREIYIKDIYDTQLQRAMDTQHKWTIHEIRNEISSIKGNIDNFCLNKEEFINNPKEIVEGFGNLKNNYDEFECVLNWVTELMNGKKPPDDEHWVSNEDMKWAFDSFVFKFINTDELENFIETTDEHGKPLFETNNDEVFDIKNSDIQYELPFFTYQKLLHELSKNILKYADRSKKCYFMFNIEEQFLTFEIKNTFARNDTHMLSTGKGLELFERFLKVYNNESFIDRSGLINKNIGDECVCRIKIAINIRRKN